MQVKLSGDEHSHVLVVSGGECQAEVVAVPVERVDRLPADHHPLQPPQPARHAASRARGVCSVTLIGVLAAGKQFIY